MAVIPNFDGRFGQKLDSGAAAPTAQSHVNPARTDTLVKAGQVISGVADDATKLYVAQQERVAANYATSSTAALQESVIRDMTAAKQRAAETGDVEGFTDSFLKNFDSQGANVLKNAPNNMAREVMKDRLAKTRMSLLQDSMKFEADTRVAIYSHNLDKAADSYAKAATMDPSQMPLMLQQMDGDMVAAKHTLGLVAAEERAQFYKNQIVATAISGQVYDNPEAAESLINQYQADLSAKDLSALKSSVDSSRRRIENEKMAANRTANARAEVFGALTDNIPLDPTNKKNREAFDDYYRAVKAENPNADFTQEVLKTNILPGTMKNEISGKLANGDTSQKVQAARQLAALHEAAPSLVGDLSKDDKAKAAAINSYLDAGVDPKRAIEWAEKETSDIKDPVIKARAKEAAKDDKLKFKAIQSNFTSFFGNGPEAIPMEMKSEYEVLAQSYYTNNGLDAAKAQRAALNDVRANWSLSSVIGRKRYMKNAPELAYKNGMDSKWIKEQFDSEFIGKKLLGDKIGSAEDLKNIIIEPSQLIFRNGMPVYNLYTLNEENGNIDAVYDDKGNAVVYYPDFESSNTYKQLLEQVPGETPEQKRDQYLRDMQEQQVKQLTRGQQPAPMIHQVNPGGL